MSTLPKSMRAVVCPMPGPISTLELQQVPLPVPKDGQLLLKILAFGINRSEMYTRQGRSPGSELPQILGIECIGIVAGHPTPSSDTWRSRYPLGSMVATCMGGLGRTIPGSYAEYTCVAADNIRPVPPTKSLTVAEIAALPEMLQTTWGALTAGLGVRPGDSVLVRGATSSIGLCALQLARKLGAGRIGGTTRNPGRETLLLSHGADEVFIDDGNIAEKVAASRAGRFNKILELVGTISLRDSAKCATAGGIVCMAGIQGGGKRVMEEFSPLIDLPNRVKLCSYAGDTADFLAMPWEDLVRDADDGVFKIPVVTFKLDEIHKVHQILEEGGGGHKMVGVLADT